jgi:hypothetical protein
MIRLESAHVATMLVISGLAWGCANKDDDPAGKAPNSRDAAERTSKAETNPRDGSEGNSKSKPDHVQQYEAELARIEDAQPQPLPDRETEEDLRRKLRNSKKVRYGNGWAYVPRNPKPPRRTATAAVPGCESRTYTDDSGEHTTQVPKPPGVTARLIGSRQVLVTYQIGGDEDCPANWLDLTAQVSNKPLRDFSRSFRIRHRSGQVVFALPEEVVGADVLHASSWAKIFSGAGSRTTTIRIR